MAYNQACDFCEAETSDHSKSIYYACDDDLGELNTLVA